MTGVPPSGSGSRASHEAADASSPKASIPNAERGPEMTRLLNRLYGNPKRRVLHFNAWWGPEAHKLTVEQRAAAINQMLDEIESGRATPVSFDEDFEQIDASAIEARSDATGTGAAEGESAGPQDDANA